ncbi:hypothetical protein FIBSPDRAFT_885695 [Athelia psychrophila]|uniref:Uncharacterized protein n=1 Tax=Athelia psychrophila TaxID=1759441 RepID=A0A166RMT8_9AGAM|nr:hypothetical protein FIBSPDRAFT_885695 [Fibularhizoctonia sp. CBS 109695]
MALYLLVYSTIVHEVVEPPGSCKVHLVDRRERGRQGVLVLSVRPDTCGIHVVHRGDGRVLGVGKDPPLDVLATTPPVTTEGRNGYAAVVAIHVTASQGVGFSSLSAVPLENNAAVTGSSIGASPYGSEIAAPPPGSLSTSLTKLRRHSWSFYRISSRANKHPSGPSASRFKKLNGPGVICGVGRTRRPHKPASVLGPPSPPRALNHIPGADVGSVGHTVRVVGPVPIAPSLGIVLLVWSILV